MRTSLLILSDLLARIAVLPASSAQAERMFSTIKRVKDARRHRLKALTLDNLIRISSEGSPLVQWDPTPAMMKWESWGNRRITLTSHNKPGTTLVDESESEEDFDTVLMITFIYNELSFITSVISCYSLSL